MRKRSVLIFFAVFAIWPSSSVVQSQEGKDMSPQAKTYLQEALDIMQKNSLRKKQVDCDTLLRETFARAAGGEQTVDTYEAIRFALRSLDDNHSFLQLSRELEEKEKARHKLPTGISTDKMERPPSPYIPRRNPDGSFHRTNGCVIPRIVVPIFPSASKKGDAFATQMQQFITEADAKKPCGWIVDLRGNGGGNVFPMLAGIGALLEEDDIVSSLDAEGRKTFYFYRHGLSGFRNPSGSEMVITRVEGDPYHVSQGLPITF